MDAISETFMLEYLDIPRVDIQRVIMRKVLPYPETWTVSRVSPDIYKQYTLLINIRVPGVRAFHMKSSLFFYIYAKDMPLSFRNLL